MGRKKKKGQGGMTVKVNETTTNESFDGLDEFYATRASERQIIDMEVSADSQSAFENVTYVSEVDYDPTCETEEHTLNEEVPAFMQCKDSFSHEMTWMCAQCVLDIGPGQEREDWRQTDLQGSLPGLDTIEDDSTKYTDGRSYWGDSNGTWKSKNPSTALPTVPKATEVKPYVPLRSCEHNRQPFSFKDGEGRTHTIVCSAHTDKSKKFHPDAKEPDLSVFLASSWLYSIKGRIWMNPLLATVFPWKSAKPEGGPVMYIDWADMGDVPVDEIKPAVDIVVDSLSKDNIVEVGCIGAHGRTGTFICLVLVSFGWSAADAMKALRKHYCDRAVESKKQEEMIRKFEEAFYG